MRNRRAKMTNREKLREVFPKTIFLEERSAEGKIKALICSDEWLDAEYKEPKEAAGFDTSDYETFVLNGGCEKTRCAECDYFSECDEFMA